MNQPDNVYLNLTINNPIENDTIYPQNKVAIYDETLSQAVLTNSSNYYASIIRFSLPIDSVPLFVMPINSSLGQTNPNLTNLLIGIDTGVFPAFIPHDQFIIYKPANNLNPPVLMASTQFSFTQITDQYYFCYSIQLFVNMINTALALSFVAAGSPGGGVSPYYVFDSKTQLMSIIVTAAFLGSGAHIYMNAALKVYLDSFTFNTINNINTGALRFVHDFTALPYGGTSPYQFLEEYVSMDLWLDARKIIVTTNSIPIVLESSPTYTPSSFNPNGLAAYSPIISDYILSFNNIADISSVITYVPSAQYRLTDLSSNQEINRIQLQFWWLSESGIQYPIYITPGQAITLKLYFGKKSIYKNPM